jgi:hypothetical protein
MFFAELLDGHPAALLLGNAVTPLVGGAGLPCGGGVAHDTNLRPSPPLGKRVSSDAYAQLYTSGGRTRMDLITQQYMDTFCKEHTISQSLDESRKFEHFSAYVVFRREQSGTIDTHDVLTGDDSASSSSGGSDRALILSASWSTAL